MNRGKYSKAIDRLSLVQGLANYKDVSTKLGEATAKLAEQERQTEVYQAPSLEYFAILFSIIFGLLSALVQSTFSFVNQLSRPWGASVLAGFYLITLVIIILTKKRSDSIAKRTEINPDG